MNCISCTNIKNDVECDLVNYYNNLDDKAKNNIEIATLCVENNLIENYNCLR